MDTNINYEEKLESVITNIMHCREEEKVTAPSITLLDELRIVLTELFAESGLTCTNAIFTINTDKTFFGVMINPLISGNETMAILATEDDVRLSKFEIELDSKLFGIGLEPAEIAATIIHDVSAMMVNPATIANVRAIIDLNNLKDDDVIYLRDSANYTQLITLAIKDTMYKVSSIMFKQEVDEIVADQYIQAYDLQDIVVDAQQKVTSSLFGLEDTLRQPKASLMNWVLIMYKDVRTYARTIRDTLKDAEQFTASRLKKNELETTIDCVNKITNQLVTEGTLEHVLEANHISAVLELSIFQSLKKRGLRSIEDDYYEFAMRVKACETEEDAIYILRGINTRLSILEDYIYNNPDLSDNERKHWEDVCSKYRALREAMSKKKVWDKKQYGIWVDYNQMDKLDED